MKAKILGIATALPKRIETNQDLSDNFPEWSAEKIGEKTGIYSRHIASDSEFSSSLATQACKSLFEKLQYDVGLIDLMLLVTQTPDFALPTTACLVHESLGLRRDSGAMDINLGCSGYVVALATANAFIESGIYKNILVVTADTYSKLLNPEDKTVRTIFGDGASATIVAADDGAQGFTGFVNGTDGSGAKYLLTPNGGLRSGDTVTQNSLPLARGLEPSKYDLYMDGAGIFNFTLAVIGETLDKVLEKSGKTRNDIDYFVFHQANEFMLQHIVKKTGLPPEKCPILMRDTGNTVSSTIPFALEKLINQGAITTGSSLVLVGFGVGLSWAGLQVSF